MTESRLTHPVNSNYAVLLMVGILNIPMIIENASLRAPLIRDG